MKRKKSLKFKVESLKFQYIAIGIMILFGCNKNNWQKTPTGLQYTIYESKGGAKVQVGDAMQLHLTYKNSHDSVLFDSETWGEAFMIELKEPPYKGSLEEGFAMLGEGDSASFLVIADSVYNRVFVQPMPSHILPGEQLRVDVRLNKILTPNQYKSLTHQQENVVVIDEDQKIKKYMANNQLSAIPDASGLYFISFVDGTGKQPKMGDKLEVSYLVRSLNGELFDQSDKNFQFQLGDTTMVEGWNLGITKMKEGGKARFILPSKLGYGGKGNGKIPPSTPLVFDVDLIKVK